MDWDVQCEYQHVVFTLPHLLNPWIQLDPGEVYKLLLRAVQDVLMQRHKKSFGCVPGLLVFLHTWGQRMKRHVHAHVILTGGGLSLDGQQWVAVDHRSPLLSRESLAADFKEMFLRRLKSLLSKLQKIAGIECDAECEEPVAAANDVSSAQQTETETKAETKTETETKAETKTKTKDKTKTKAKTETKLSAESVQLAERTVADADLDTETLFVLSASESETKVDAGTHPISTDNNPSSPPTPGTRHSTPPADPSLLSTARITGLLEELGGKRWMVNNQSPPAGKSGPDAVVNYLARYVAGVAISDSRILSDDGTHVSFRYKDYQTGSKSIETITGQEFVQRFCMHILPKHSSRLRTVGIFQTKKRQAKLGLVRHLISGGTFEAFEQARIAAKLAHEQAAKVAAESTTNQAIVSLLELKLSVTNDCHNHSWDSLEVDVEPFTAEEMLAWERRREADLQAHFDQWPKLSVDDDIRLALQAILPKPEESSEDGCDVGRVVERESVEARSAIHPHTGPHHDPQPTKVGPPNGPLHSGPRHSSDGKRLSASVWRSRYNGCRRCGEEMTKLSHWGQYDTERIYQAVGGLLALLTMVPWKEMTIALEQLRAGQVDLSHWPLEIQQTLDGTYYFCKIRYKAVYWYLIEMIAQKLKTGELRNPKIYEFNPDILYDPKRKKSKKTLPNERAKTIPANGIPPPGKKT